MWTAVTRSIWFQKFCEDSAAGSTGSRRVRVLRRLLGPLGGCHQVVDFAEVDGADDLGFAIDAMAKAGVVIGVAANLFWSEARHP